MYEFDGVDELTDPIKLMKHLSLETDLDISKECVFVESCFKAVNDVSVSSDGWFVPRVLAYLDYMEYYLRLELSHRFLDLVLGGR